MNSTHSAADSRIQEIMGFEELSISEYSPSYSMKTEEVKIKHDLSSNPNRMMTAEIGVQNDLSDTISATGLEEIISVNFLAARTSSNITEKVNNDENAAVSISSNSHTQEDMTEFILPPMCKTAGRRDSNGSITLLETEEKHSDADYDSDATCHAYVECGEKGICKCQRIQGKDYYEYYVRTKDKDHVTMYPPDKCTLLRGAVFHFTGAPDTLKREDVNDALVALGAKIKFVDYETGNKEGWVRLSYKYEARIIIKKMIDKKLNIAGAELNFRVLSGKDEKRYHKKAVEAIYQLHAKAKGLEKKLKKAGYSYVKNYNWQ